MSFSWTPESETKLLALYDKGDSMSLIARHLGKGLTRNAVCGKLHRLGAVRPERSKAETIIAGLASRKAQKPRSAPKPPPRPMTAQEPPKGATERQAAGVTLLALTGRHCRWPIAQRDGDWVFCGAAKIDGSPYCVEHTAKAFVPGKPGHGRLDRLWRFG